MVGRQGDARPGLVLSGPSSEQERNLRGSAKLFVIWADAVRTAQPRPTLNGVMLS